LVFLVNIAKPEASSANTSLVSILVLYQFFGINTSLVGLVGGEQDVT
jgi:hypothetical protein